MATAEIILWTGPKHSGKTTAAGGLVDRLKIDGYSVGGILAPSLYDHERLVGFDVADIASGRRKPLLRLGQPSDVGPFVFQAEGLALGQSALARPLSRERSDLIVVDEFGPLELDSRGWRQAVDNLIEANVSLVLLVVREELCETASQLYASHSVRILSALDPESTGHVERLVSQRAESCG